MIKLESFQSIREFTREGMSDVSLRVIGPSKGYGGWPGNEYTIREWTVVEEFTGVCKRPTNAEVIEFEKELGEVEIKNIHFLQHPTLGNIVAVFE